MSSFASIPVSIQEADERVASHRDLFVCLLLLLAWLPIPIGSNRTWSLALFEAAALSIFGIWALRYAHRPFVIPGPVKELRLAWIILCIWLCYPLIQMVPVPAWLGQSVTGDLHRLYSDLPGLAASESLYFSLDRGATLAGMLRQFALVAVFFSVVSIAGSRKRLRALLVLLFVVGFAQAIYGLMVYLGGGELGLWNPGHDAGTVAGTYVNQNHFAGLMEMTISAGLGLLITGFEPQETGRGLRGALRTLSSMILGHRGLLLFGLVVMFAALILSTSRGAVGSLAIAIVLAILIANRRKGAGALELKVGVIAAVLIFLAALWLGLGQLSNKLEASGLASNRDDLRELSYRMIADSPFVGTGIGTYRWVLPQHKDERFGSGFYEHAHNDYLEMLSEQGIVGFSLLVVALALFVARIIAAFRLQQDALIRGALFSVVVGCTSLLLHGLVDFNLQIPANAAYFFVLLGMGVVAADLGGRSNQ